jgi:hypothetical protein
MGGLMALRARLRMLACCLLGAATLAGALASATPAFGFASEGLGAGGSPTGVSCGSESLCAAVTSGGYAFTTSAPGSGAVWTQAAIDEADAPLQAVSCAPTGPCVAVDAHGYAFVASDPAASGWARETIDPGNSLTGISCPSASLCVAVDASGNVLTSTAPAGGGWSSAAVDPEHQLTGVSCATSSLCVAIDSAGRVLESVDPAKGGATWHADQVDFTRLTAVSCAASLCVAVDHDGDVLASADPGAPAPTWSLTTIAAGALTSVGCATTGRCLAGEEGGRLLFSDDVPASEPTWGHDEGVGTLSGISCLPGGLCVMTGTYGVSYDRAPAPRVETLAAPQASLTSSSAEVLGIADPEGALADGCVFEYGTTPDYTASVSCAEMPSAGGGEQPVHATLGALAPNTTYHYRLVVATPSGVGRGEDESFTTATSPSVALVYPHPSITGTPAVNQQLACHPGTPAASATSLSYLWLRDTVAIAGSAGSVYDVKGQDSGHHLQCEVTATDGGGSATAKSAFVTIPVGGVTAASGETTVGAARVRGGTRVSVPIGCSPLADGGCEIDLSLTAVETLADGRIVAIDAQRRSHRHAAIEAVTRQRTIQLAGSRLHVASGVHTTLTLALGRAALRLLTALRLRRVPASLHVSGTVIGVIEAQLSTQLVQLNVPARAGRSAHARTARGSGAGARRARSQHASAAGAHLLAATPYMGWDTYFALGGRYSESTILQEASALKTLGLEQLGYRYVWLDVGWWHGQREADGQIAVNGEQWPHGLAWLTRTLHAAGFLVGLYTDAGPNGCGGAGQGSYGHYQQDVDTFAAWGFDAVKVDFCGGAEYHLSPATAYGQFHAAIAANPSHRPMLLSICDFLQPEQYGEGRPGLEESAFTSYAFGPTDGNSWRTDTDVGLPGNVPFADVLRNLDADAADPQAAGPGHWNDPDYLAPDQGMSAVQFRTQLSMWAMLAAPLMISDDLRHLSAASLQTLRNSEVIAIDQDPAGLQGRLLSAAGAGEVWVKPLAGGSRAVALLNRGSSPMRIATSANAIGMPHAAGYRVRNVWTHADTASAGAIAAQVPGDGAVLLRVSGA